MLGFLHHLLFPRESNNHRAKILHHDSLIVIICLFLFVTSLFAAVSRTSPDVLGISFNISAGDLLAITNQKRQENGLGPLSMNGQLASAAEQKAAHMFANNYWAHIAPDGTTPWFFIKNSGYPYLYAGENLARGFTSSGDVINGWMNSPTHRENMLSANYKDIGFAIREGSLTGSDTILVVEMLGSTYGGGSSQPQAAVQPTTAPTVAVAAITPKPSAVPTAVPTSTPTPTPTPKVEKPIVNVAAASNNPLIDSRSTSNKIALGFLALLIAILIIDAVIIEKKQIIRVVAHNLDHIIFLIIIAIVIIIISRGIIL